jgi:anti-sigma B factor antagonist
MPELAKLTFDSEGDVELAKLAGEVDASNVDHLSEKLLERLSNDSRAVVIDLTDTSYIDSSGISLIFDAAARLRNRKQELRLVVAPESFVAEVLRAVSMQESVAIDPAVDDALREVGGP